jgi:hypothetical protein
MVDPESPAARRHRIAYAVRNASSVDAAAQLLDVYERECTVAPLPAPDALDEVDVPWELCELESLADWRYETLLQFAIDRREAPVFHFEGEAHPRTMHARDLLASRRYELIGLLSLACEQAWNLGDAKSVKAMSMLCESAVSRVVGMAALRVALGGGDAGEG